MEGVGGSRSSPSLPLFLACTRADRSSSFSQQPLTDGPWGAPPSQAQPPPAATSSAAAVARRLAGVSRLTLSVPGLLLEEWEPAELGESARVRAGAADALRHAARCAEVFLLAQVDDEVGEATVSGALEHAGLVGRGAGQVPRHRLLFCSTLDGKVAIVRQLEPGLHLDGSAHTVRAGRGAPGGAVRGNSRCSACCARCSLRVFCQRTRGLGVLPGMPADRRMD